MPYAGPERRRSPRATVAGSQSWLSVPSTWPVQVLDVSTSGMAFSSPYGLEVGRTLVLRTTMGQKAFTGEIRVCWSSRRDTPNSVRPRFEIGAVFLPLEDSSRSALESFLKVAAQ